MSDYPNLRATLICPRCEKSKDHGLVICWPCNAQLKRIFDGTWGVWEGKLAVIESGLAAKAAYDTHLLRESRRWLHHL